MMAKAKVSKEAGSRMVEISYCTRDIGYGVESGQAFAYVTDEVDTWGKRTIFIALDPESVKWERWYLFPDEWSRD